MVTPDSEDQEVSREIAIRGFQLVKDFRSLGLSCDFDPLRRSIKAQMKHANRLNARYVVILGEEELKKNAAAIRSMEHGWQKEVALGLVLGFMKEELSGGSN